MTATWVGAGPTLYSDYQLATLGAALPTGLLAGDMLFAFYAGRAGTPVVRFSPDWTQMPLIGGGVTWAMAWHQYVVGDAAPIIRASATHMTWCTVLAYRGVGFAPKTGLPYEGLSMNNPEGGQVLVDNVNARLPFPVITPQGNGRLLVKLGVAWLHDNQDVPTAKLSIYDAMTERGPLAQQRSVAPQGHQLLRFSSVMDMPGSWDTPASGNAVDTTNGDIVAYIATLGLALYPAS